MQKQIKVSSKGKEGDGKEKYCQIYILTYWNAKNFKDNYLIMLFTSIHSNNSNYVIGVHDVLEWLYGHIHAVGTVGMMFDW